MGDSTEHEEEAFDKARNNLTCSFCGTTFTDKSFMDDPILSESREDNKRKSWRPICKGCKNRSDALEYRRRMEEELPEGEELTITTIDDPLGPERE
jgi:hypothetical protein